MVLHTRVRWHAVPFTWANGSITPGGIQIARSVCMTGGIAYGMERFMRISQLRVTSWNSMAICSISLSLIGNIRKGRLTNMQHSLPKTHGLVTSRATYLNWFSHLHLFSLRVTFFVQGVLMAGGELLSP